MNVKYLFTADAYCRVVAAAQPCCRINRLPGSPREEVSKLPVSSVRCAGVKHASAVSEDCMMRTFNARENVGKGKVEKQSNCAESRNW